MKYRMAHEIRFARERSWYRALRTTSQAVKRRQRLAFVSEGAPDPVDHIRRSCLVTADPDIACERTGLWVVAQVDAKRACPRDNRILISPRVDGDGVEIAFAGERETKFPQASSEDRRQP